MFLSTFNRLLSRRQAVMHVELFKQHDQVQVSIIFTLMLSHQPPHANALKQTVPGAAAQIMQEMTQITET